MSSFTPTILVSRVRYVHELVELAEVVFSWTYKWLHSWASKFLSEVPCSFCLMKMSVLAIALNFGRENFYWNSNYSLPPFPLLWILCIGTLERWLVQSSFFHFTRQNGSIKPGRFVSACFPGKELLRNGLVFVVKFVCISSFEDCAILR